MKEGFVDWRPNKRSRDLLDWIDQIVYSYEQQGYRLTLRQLYYQLVSREVIPKLLTIADDFDREGLNDG